MDFWGHCHDFPMIFGVWNPLQLWLTGNFSYQISLPKPRVRARGLIVAAKKLFEVSLKNLAKGHTNM